jgi:hypothetical protein
MKEGERRTCSDQLFSSRQEKSKNSREEREENTPKIYLRDRKVLSKKKRKNTCLV